MIIMSSLAGINFFAVVKSFDAHISISANFVLTVKNSNLRKQSSHGKLNLQDDYIVFQHARIF